MMRFGRSMGTCPGAWRWGTDHVSQDAFRHDPCHYAQPFTMIPYRCCITVFATKPLLSPTTTFTRGRQYCVRYREVQPCTTG